MKWFYRHDETIVLAVSATTTKEADDEDNGSHDQNKYGDGVRSHPDEGHVAGEASLNDETDGDQSDSGKLTVKSKHSYTRVMPASKGLTTNSCRSDSGKLGVNSKHSYTRVIPASKGLTANSCRSDG